MKGFIDTTEKQIREAQEILHEFPRKAPQAIIRALNRGVTNINSNISKEVRKEYNIKAGDITPTLNVVKATTGHLGASVRSRSGVIPLDRFKISPKTINPRRKPPIKAEVKKGVRKSLGSGFMADIHGPKVFRRSGKSRLPIQRLFGPAVPQMIGNEKVREKIEREGQEMFERTLDHEIKRILDNATRR